MHLNHVRSKHGLAIGSVHVALHQAEPLPPTFRSLPTPALVAILERFDRTSAALEALMWWNPALRLAAVGGVFWLLTGVLMPLLHSNPGTGTAGASMFGLVVVAVGLAWHQHSAQGLSQTAATVQRRRSLVLAVLMERPDWHG